jgi:hypothetical protein
MTELLFASHSSFLPSCTLFTRSLTIFFVLLLMSRLTHSKNDLNSQSDSQADVKREWVIQYFCERFIDNSCNIKKSLKTSCWICGKKTTKFNKQLLAHIPIYNELLSQMPASSKARCDQLGKAIIHNHCSDNINKLFKEWSIRDWSNPAQSFKKFGYMALRCIFI